MSRERLQDLVLGIFGIGLFLGAWEVIGANGWAGLTWPRFSTVIAYLLDPARAGLFGRAMAASFSMVATGFVLGTALGFLAAMLVYIVKPLHPGIDRLASTINAASVVVFLATPNIIHWRYAAVMATGASAGSARRW